MTRFILTGTALFAGIAFAQGVPKNDVFIEAVPAMPVAGTAMFIGGEMAGRTVKNAPYSAETTSESVQVLTDGNKIVNKSVTQFYRDAEGRTRHETKVTPVEEGEGHSFVTIDDPVAGVHYILNDEKKTATKITLLKPPEGEKGANVRFMSRASATVASSADAPTAAPLMTFATTRVHLADRLDSNQNLSTESLGNKVMEGVNVKGTRTTFTIPAGRMGNEKPIISITENWVSEELGAQIYSKHTDPRFGDSTTKTTNIQRADQPRYLFEVPADYKVTEPSADILSLEKVIAEKKANRKE